MSTLARLERQMKLKREQAPPASSSLGEAIADLIREAAQAGAEAAVEKQVKPPQNPAARPYLRDFTDKPEQHSFPPPPPTTKPPRDLTVQLHRDAAGKPIFASVGDVRFEIQRNAEGRVMRMVQVDESPTLPPPPGEPI